MKHALAKVASALAGGALLAASLAGPAGAQLQGMPRSDLPAQGSTDPEIDPFPFDPRLEIRSYVASRLPTEWWAKEPIYNLGLFSVEIHPPAAWRGNPTSAMMRLCPPARHEIWRHLQKIELRPFYHDAPWPAFTCRPGTVP
ncbi:hypothetical protein DFO45_4519 [Azorhizobium sp. AG788]|uniref:hypothetical protein n=1 Tax=Azorhizobium sp. AG788 TaxID=2183897 RepID=UPI00105EE2B6|nr:hypothetical protein [Azorhizobium sp. AG788]TDT89596.1 hypothetical protein DFO45_4519 [Azorhizobium sp. AG788]